MSNFWTEFKNSLTANIPKGYEKVALSISDKIIEGLIKLSPSEAKVRKVLDEIVEKFHNPSNIIANTICQIVGENKSEDHKYIEKYKNPKTGKWVYVYERSEKWEKVSEEPKKVVEKGVSKLEKKHSKAKKILKTGAAVGIGVTVGAILYSLGKKSGVKDSNSFDKGKQIGTKEGIEHGKKIVETDFETRKKESYKKGYKKGQEDKLKTRLHKTAEHFTEKGYKQGIEEGKNKTKNKSSFKRLYHEIEDTTRKTLDPATYKKIMNNISDVFKKHL